MRSIAVLLLCLAVAPSVAGAQPRLLQPVTERGAAAQARVDGMVRSRAVAVDWTALPGAVAAGGSVVQVDLFADRGLRVIIETVTATDGTTTFRGRVDGDPGGRFLAVRAGAALAADVDTGAERYEIRATSSGAHVVHQIDPAFIPGCATEDRPTAGAMPLVDRTREAARAAFVEGLIAPVTVDVLLAFTPAAQAGAGGPGGMQALAQLAIQDINDSLARSQVAHRMRLVGVMVTPYVESNDYYADISRASAPNDGYMDDVPRARDNVNADLVALIVEKTDPRGFAGVGNLMFGFSKGLAPNAYSVNARPYLTGRVLAHEIGHNLGLHHDRANLGGGTSFLPYGYGYQLPGTFYTIMAYACAGCRSIPYYSNPDVAYNGAATGVRDFAEEARAIEQTAPVAASYRGCPTGVTPLDPEIGGAGGPVRFDITTPPGCWWGIDATSNPPTWLTPPVETMGTGPVQVAFTAAPLPPGTPSRSAYVYVDGRPYLVVQRTTIDVDTDGLPDWWEGRYGLSSASSTGVNGASGDPDADGRTNLQEYQAGTHPRGSLRRYLAEGAGGSFFKTRLALLNPGATAANVQLRFAKDGGGSSTHYLLVPARGRRTVSSDEVSGLGIASFSTLIESDQAVVVDRTMNWDAGAYGSHAETAIESPATTWYLAEGSTSDPFSLFYLLQNPGETAVEATIRFLRASGPPLEVTRTLPPLSRTTIPIDDLLPELQTTDVSGVITAAAPIIVERAMYRSTSAQVFAAGHGSAGVTAPATTWFLAEGATGPFFDLFVLLANPSAADATVRVDYLLLDGTTFSKTYTVPANRRFTIWVDDEVIAGVSGKPLANVAVSTTVTSTNDVPIIVERAMWWPGPEVTANFWTEAHNSAGSTSTGVRWGLAEGEVGGPDLAETYILIANPSASAGQARVSLFFEDGASAMRVVDLLPRSRTNVNVSTDFPSAAGKRFGTLIESLGASPAPIVVERAMYTSPLGATWAAGTNALATKLP